ncbi:amidase family protein [Actinosynnema sp. CA-248983]
MLSLADWQSLTPADRSRRRAEAVDRAKGSTHGDWITVLRDRPPGAGPLSGIPFSVKDNVDVRGVPTTAGSPLLGDSPAAVDATVVGALVDAGGVVVGKTNLHELAFGITSNNRTFGPVRNPVDPSRSAGGSSGGSAVGVALGVVPFALGTDTGGSVTIPASFCGVVGFRPSTGRYPGDGVVNLSTTRDTIGVLARTVRDVRVVDEVITGTSTEAPASLTGLRIGLPHSRFRDIDPEVARVVREAVAVLERSGAHVLDVDLGDDLAIAGGAGMELVLFEAPRLLARRVPLPPGQWPDRIASPGVRALIEAMTATPLPVETYERARATRWRLRQTYTDAFREVDLLLGPTTPVTAPKVGADDSLTLNGRSVPTFATVTRNTSPGTVAGVPMVSVPVGATRDGLPVGVCLEGRPFADLHLLAVAEAVQDALTRTGGRP